MRQERPLDVGDDLQLAIDDLVGLLQLVGEDEVLGRPAEEVADPDPLGELVGVEGARLLLQRTTMFSPTPWSKCGMAMSDL